MVKQSRPASQPALILPVAIALVACTLPGMPVAHADNRRLNDGVVQNVYAIRHQVGCTTDIKVDPRLRLAAEWHTNDVLNNRTLDGDIGSDGSAPRDRANAAGYFGGVAETVAVNPALAISPLELLRMWYYDPESLAIMRDCNNTAIGVWSANRFDRSVVVAVYGKPL